MVDLNIGSRCRVVCLLALAALSCWMTLPLAAQASADASAEPVVASEASESAANPLFEKLRGSGKTGAALFLISVVGFSFAFERLYNLRKSLVVPEGLAGRADALWQKGEVDAIGQLTAAQPSALGRVIHALVEHRDASHGDVSMIAGDIASREMRYHLLRAYPLAVVATISPLLGLFGTVYGMIGAFESVALAGEMGDPSIMAGDISYALITTALGLVIAVPALAAYHYFRIRTRLFSLSLEEQAGHLISRWFAPQRAASQSNEDA